jgi:hypothetical protein
VHVIGILDAEEAKIKSEIENLLEKLNKKAVTIEMLRSKLSALKLYASDLQTFLGGPYPVSLFPCYWKCLSKYPQYCQA